MLVDGMRDRSLSGVLDLPALPADVHRRQPTRLGAVYTPQPVARWLAREVVRRLPGNAPHLVVDPACGDGALLAAVADEAPDADLIGLDIDRRAVRAARERLDRASIAHTDGLTSPWGGARSPFAGVIANPPWGADVLHGRDELAAAGYSLATGQFDSYELFVERAIDQLPIGGVAGFLIPDSLLLPEHEALRRLLVERTRLELLVRLGEGIFDGVFRGTIAVVFVVGAPAPDHVVRCCRVRDAERRQVLAGSRSLADVIAQHGHDVHQLQFAGRHAAIDVDATEADRAIVTRMSQTPAAWVPWLRAYRGVEIGKFGLVALCPRCGSARPVRPNSDRRTTCESCGYSAAGSSDTTAIIRPRASDGDSSGWHSLLAGEDVGRYAVTPRREIRLGVRGIRYKDPALFAATKLLVRKTGVGLQATLDESGALTTQTVFHFLPTPAAPEFALPYVLGVLNSRIMLAYHLKRHGDVEWRSHPYVTPKLLASLPVPLPAPGTQQWQQAVTIAAAVRELLRAQPADRHDLDLQIESLVAGLFAFTEDECGWVDSVLGQAQQLRAIAALRLRPGDELRPVTAA